MSAVRPLPSRCLTAECLKCDRYWRLFAVHLLQSLETHLLPAKYHKQYLEWICTCTENVPVRPLTITHTHLLHTIYIYIALHRRMLHLHILH